MPRLLLNFGTPQEYQFPLRTGLNRAGRSGANDIGVEHPSVAEPHCELDVLEDGTAQVRDLGSAAGTFIDSTPVAQGVLRSGQVLKLGEVELLFDADTPADLIPPIAQPAKPEPFVPPPTLTAAPQPPAEPLPLPDGPLRCHNHPKTQPTLQCQQCGRLYCELCATTRREGGALRKFCRECGGLCQWLSAWVLRPHRDSRTFFQQTPSAFLYPFQGDGFILMILGTLFYTFVEFVSFAAAFAFIAKGATFVVFLFAYGYLFAYLMKIITSTVQGRDEMPDWPDFMGMGDVTGPFFQVVVTLLVCVAPGVATLLFFQEEDWGSTAALAFFALGAFYLPMAFLAISMFDAFEVLNPLFIFPSILRVLREYLVAFGLLAGIVIFDIAFHFTLAMFLPVKSLLVVLLSGACSGFVGFYLLTVEMRILGILYRTQQDELGWFRRSL